MKPVCIEKILVKFSTSGISSNIKSTMKIEIIEIIQIKFQAKKS